MTPSWLFLSVAATLFVIALQAALTARHHLRRLIALNVLSSSVFLVFVTLSRRAAPFDPVPHAMVLTGIVVAVAATGLAIALVRRDMEEGREPRLPEDRLREEEPPTERVPG